MIEISLFYKQQRLYRCRFSGHAGYAQHGEDIVCAGVSTLALTTISAIEQLTKEKMVLKEVDNKKGIIDCYFPEREKGRLNAEATLLLEAMCLGLKSIQEMYGEYITIHYKKN
jgi:hypothetical protein